MDDASESVGLVFLCDNIFDFTTISGAFFIVIFILSLTGNGLLLCLLFIYENLKNVNNLFVLNVACSDLVFTLSLPFWAVYYLHHWVFGDFLCKCITAAYHIGVYSSIILLTAMTVDRFLTVVLNTGRPKRQLYAVCTCVAAWLISIAASLRDVISVTAETDENNYTWCDDLSEGQGVKLGYYLQVSLLFFLPLAIIVLCYSAILKTLLQRPNRLKHRATVVVVLCIVAAFFLCWGPFHMLIFTATFYKPIECDAQELFEIAYSVCRILAYSHCCVNPLLYMMSRTLRKHLSHLLSCKNPGERTNNKKRGASGTSVYQNVSMIAQNSAEELEMQSKK
ncbi:chemokine XC receptor 1 [Betta splendens]|uniref:Chemokine XC receptor 1 n=1 Tax=Betta splendens TaxID=158456 RepID=A0A6P7L2K9_BETSP|nr:chemokine XC receptor 1 [Betta splendens]